MGHNQKHQLLAPHLEPVVRGRDETAKNMYLVMRRILRKERQAIWDRTATALTDVILYGSHIGRGWIVK